MAFELVYTSAPSGVKQGTSGFCTVACTRGMGPALLQKLEGLSAYKPCFPHYAPNAWDNPVSCQHYRVNLNGCTQHILSRICFNGVDHTQRSNKLASHLVLSEQEAALAAGGPASLFLQPNLFKDASWNIHPELYDTQRTIPATAPSAGRCEAWQAFAGDAGWAGVLAESFQASSRNIVYLVFDPLRHKNLVPLVEEALRLLSPEERWQVTFNTYFITLPAGLSCNWRFCVAGEPALTAARRSPNTLILDLTAPLPPAVGGPLVEAARTGNLPRHAEPACVAVPAPAAESLKEETVPEETATLQSPVIGKSRVRRNVDTSPVESRPREGQSGGWAAIVVALVLLLATVAGGLWWYMRGQNRQNTIQLTKVHCTNLQTELNRLPNLQTIEREVLQLEGSTLPGSASQRLAELKEKLCTIQTQYAEIQTKSQEYQETLLRLGASTEDTPLAEIQTILQNTAKEHQDLLQRITAAQQKFQTSLSSKQETQSAPRQHETTAKEPASPQPVPAKALPQTPATQKEPHLPVTPENGRFTWYRSAELYGNLRNKPFRLAVGETAKGNDFSIRLHFPPPAQSPFEHFLEKGSDFDAPAQAMSDDAKRVCFHIELKDGYLEISLPTGRPQIPQHVGVEVCDSLQKRQYPLFFQPGYSSIRGAEQVTGKLSFDMKAEVANLTLLLSPLELPDTPENVLFQRNTQTVSANTQNKEHHWQIPFRVLLSPNLVNARNKQRTSLHYLEQILKQRRESIQNNLKSIASKNLTVQPSHDLLGKTFQTKAKEYQELHAYAQKKHGERRKRLNQAARKIKVHNKQLQLPDKEFVSFLKEQMRAQGVNRMPKETQVLEKELDLFQNYQNKLQEAASDLQTFLSEKLPLSLLDSLLELKLTDTNNSLQFDKPLLQNEQFLKEKQKAFHQSTVKLQPDLRHAIQNASLVFLLPNQTAFSPTLPLKNIPLQDN
ncbi:MAG: hypothetical protein IJJ26_05080 [Victivallales bacterium]|nr:hypothetical protein [Victivallales bacterium]